MQWLTGFCNLKRHRHVKRGTESSKCRLCKTVDETPEHLSFYCPRLTSLQVRCFNIYDGVPDSWTPSQVETFLADGTVKDLMTDSTDYRDRDTREDTPGLSEDEDDIRD